MALSTRMLTEKNMKKVLIVFLLCIFTISSLFATTSKEVRTHWGGKLTDIIPEDCRLYEIAEKADSSPNSFSDALVRTIPYPESFESLDEDEKMLYVFNVLSAVSTLKGVTYLSWSADNQPVLLFSDAGVMKSEKEYTKVKDPVFDTLPSSNSIFALITDTKFGCNKYRIDYEVSDGEVMMTISNTDTVRYLGMKCAGSYGLKMYVDVKLAEEDIIVSSMVTVYDREPIIKVMFKTVDLPDLFMRRITSLNEWFENSI